MKTMRVRLVCLVVTAPWVLTLAGCDNTGHGRYSPTQDEARSSLDAALTAWRDGQSAESIVATPPVRVADSLWQSGEQIESFQIGEEEANDDGTKRFPVKLTIKKTKQVQDVRYIVNGRDPVWVFSEKDYQRMIDMGNGPSNARSKPASGRTRRR
jgi:DNA polymerase IIIc chi subunit